MSENKFVTLAAKGEVVSGTTNSIQVRDFEPFFVDERKEIGGNNAGPNPLEYFLGSLGACTSVIATMVAKEQGFSFGDLEFETNGDLDPRGYQGVEGVQTYYQSVEVTVVMETEESDEAFENLAKEVERRCPLFNLLKDAGVEVISNWEKK
ncbi:OsmC family protein [Carnobacteriaceae bacterium 52-44]